MAKDGKYKKPIYEWLEKTIPALTEASAKLDTDHNKVTCGSAISNGDKRLETVIKKLDALINDLQEVYSEYLEEQ